MIEPSNAEQADWSDTTRDYVHSLQIALERERSKALREAANICGTLAETTYDSADGFEAATGCEAAIMAAIGDQS